MTDQDIDQAVEMAPLIERVNSEKYPDREHAALAGAGAQGHP